MNYLILKKLDHSTKLWCKCQLKSCKITKRKNLIEYFKNYEKKKNYKREKEKDINIVKQQNSGR